MRHLIVCEVLGLAISFENTVRQMQSLSGEEAADFWHWTPEDNYYLER